MHTPGPWEVYGGHDGQFRDRPYICGWREDEPKEWQSAPTLVVAELTDLGLPTKANARLIASAPKLLEALEAAKPKLRHETDACAVVSVGTCTRCTADTAIREAKGD